MLRVHTLPLSMSGGVPSIGEIGVCILRPSSAPISLLRCFYSGCARCADVRLSIAKCNSRFSATSSSVGTIAGDP